MKISKTLLTAAATLMLSTGLCRAAVFDFDFKPYRAGPNSITASGTFTTDGAPSASTVIAVTGTVGDTDIAGIDPNGFNIYLPDTNAANFSFLDGAGISYVLSNGSNGTDLAMSDGLTSRGVLKITTDDSGSAPSPVTLPGAAPLFGAALLGLGAAGYGRRRKKTAAA